MQNSITRPLLILILILQGCATTHKQYTPSTTQLQSTQDLMRLQNMNNKRMQTEKKNTRGPNKIREAALREMALTLGAQASLSYRAKEIDEELVKHTRYLDQIFDFNALVLEHNVLPPVLLEGRNELNLADTNTIRVSNRTYKVHKQARFITAVPNWREYLWMDYTAPELPHASLLPINREEQRVWADGIASGWEKGNEQANTILEESIARIKEDFNGMILYRKLLAMNMVSPPYVSQSDLGVTGDGDEIHIDDRVLRITALPALNTNAGEWHAAVAQDEEALTRFRRLEQSINKAKITITSNNWQPIISVVRHRDTNPNAR